MSVYTVHIMHKNCGYLIPSGKGLYALHLGNLLNQPTFTMFLSQIRLSELTSRAEAKSRAFYQVIISNLFLRQKLHKVRQPQANFSLQGPCLPSALLEILSWTVHPGMLHIHTYTSQDGSMLDEFVRAHFKTHMHLWSESYSNASYKLIACIVKMYFFQTFYLVILRNNHFYL